MHPDALREEAGRLRARRMRRAFDQDHLRVEAGGHFVPVLAVHDDGFSVDAAKAAHLRGIVNLWSGRRQMAECLVVLSGREGDRVRFEFKRWTEAAADPARDFAPGDETAGG